MCEGFVGFAGVDELLDGSESADVGAGAEQFGGISRSAEHNGDEKGDEGESTAALGFGGGGIPTASPMTTPPMWAALLMPGMAAPKTKL